MTSRQFAIAAGGAVLLLLLMPGEALAKQQRLSVQETYELAKTITSNYFPKVDPLMATAVAQIESSFRPSAVREEPGGRQSTGLMQTLHDTARDMQEKGYNVYPLERISRLQEPVISMYYGCAYLNWLRTYAGQLRGEKWIVKSYNGGPGRDIPATREYWQRYQAAKAEIRRELSNAGNST